MKPRFFSILMGLALLILLASPAPATGEDDDDLLIYEVVEGLETEAPRSIFQGDGSAIITISCTGDFTIGGDNYHRKDIFTPELKKHDGDINFVMANTRDLFLEDDLTLVNFEGTLTDTTYVPENKKGNRPLKSELAFQFHGFGVAPEVHRKPYVCIHGLLPPSSSERYSSRHVHVLRPCRWFVLRPVAVALLRPVIAVRVPVCLCRCRRCAVVAAAVVPVLRLEAGQEYAVAILFPGYPGRVERCLQGYVRCPAVLALPHRAYCLVAAFPLSVLHVLAGFCFQVIYLRHVHISLLVNID